MLIIHIKIRKRKLINKYHPVIYGHNQGPRLLSSQSNCNGIDTKPYILKNNLKLFSSHLKNNKKTHGVQITCLSKNDEVNFKHCS